MFLTYDDPKVNAIALTDVDVATHWYNGLLRATAHVLITRGTADGEILGDWGRFNGYTEGSLAEHFSTTREKNMSDRSGTGGCKIVSVTNVQEEAAERWNFDTFNESKDYDDYIHGEVTCEHGNTGRMHYTTYLGGMMSQVMYADKELRGNA